MSPFLVPISQRKPLAPLNSGIHTNVPDALRHNTCTKPYLSSYYETTKLVMEQKITITTKIDSKRMDSNLIRKRIRESFSQEETELFLEKKFHEI